MQLNVHNLPLQGIRFMPSDTPNLREWIGPYTIDSNSIRRTCFCFALQRYKKKMTNATIGKRFVRKKTFFIEISSKPVFVYHNAIGIYLKYSRIRVHARNKVAVLPLFATFNWQNFVKISKKCTIFEENLHIWKKCTTFAPVFAPNFWTVAKTRGFYPSIFEKLINQDVVQENGYIIETRVEKM